MTTDKDNIVIFEPNCKIGDTVYHKLDKQAENPMIAISFTVINIDYIKNEVIDYTVGCSLPGGGLIYYKGYEIKKEEVTA